MVGRFRTGRIAFRAVAVLGLLAGPSLIARPQELSPENLERKKEGWFVVGLPFANYGTDAGFGAGAGAYLFDGGEATDADGRSNAEFRRWPYRARIGLQGFFTTLGQQRHFLNLDAPRFLDDRLSLNAEFAYVKFLNDAYFGKGNASSNGSSGSPGWNAVTTEAPSFALKLAWDPTDLLRVTAETKLKKWTVTTRRGAKDDAGRTYGETLFDRDPPPGRGGGWVNTATLRVSLDRRDFAPWPTRGFLVTAWADASPKGLSDWDFVRWGCEADGFLSPAETFTLAGRFRLLRNVGETPFTEWNALGGNADLRGFALRRFADDASLLANLEGRWRFAKWSWGREHFDLALIPFLDAGRVGPWWTYGWDFHGSVGGELILTWNLTTHLNVTWGFSDEGQNFAIDTRLLF